MKLQLATSLLLAACVHAERVVVDDPGTGNTLHFMETVPNVLGYPDIEDPRLKIDSPFAPVSILRYNDNMYLEGGQPVRKDDVYVIVKSNCTFQGAVLVDIEYSEYNRSEISEWDTANYTKSIAISITAGTNVTLVEGGNFLEPTSFLAYWNYTTHWCLKGGVATDPPSTPKNTKSSDELTADGNPTGDSASASKSGMLISLMAALASATMFLRDGTGHGKQGGGGLRVLGGLALVGVLLVSLQAHAPTANESSTKGIPNHHRHGRRFLATAGGEICSASVEIIVDGCRRAYGNDTTDLEVTTPSLRIMDVKLTELNRTESPIDTCTTNYVGSMEFDVTNASLPVATNGTFNVTSLDDSVCMRAIEGRPFVDVKGKPLQAAVCMEPSPAVAWSATGQQATSLGSKNRLDLDLGQEWADRALGEHASIAAFAAFTIALMSNNAPPSLVQDALTAAMDEVRHAQTSFEVASLLLGTTVEPGPVPPSVHSFGQDLTALALGAAQEGCVDETLSALIAAYEVDTRLNENTRIDESIKSDLKAKMRTIALEETTHSALAWRTVQWACKMDSDACSAVKSTVFDPSNLKQAFEKRFGRYGLDGNAQSAWERVYRTLIPLVLLEETPTEAADCKAVARELAETQTNLLEEMAMQVIHNTACATVEP